MQEKGNLIENLMPSYRAERDGAGSQLVDAEGRELERTLNGLRVRIWSPPEESTIRDGWGNLCTALLGPVEEEQHTTDRKADSLYRFSARTAREAKSLKQTGEWPEQKKRRATDTNLATEVGEREAVRETPLNELVGKDGEGCDAFPEGYGSTGISDSFSTTRERTITTLIPCHNEQDCVGEAIGSLLRQTRQPDRIVVVADNCTDGTAEVARSCGVEVWDTVGNTHKKAGALNQTLAKILSDLAEDDSVLVMDADSFLDERFVECAERRLAEGKYGGVGGTFQGRPGGGFVGTLQRNEFARYARDVRRLKGKVLCLTGTATLFTARALREVAKARSTREVYDVEVLTEDFELTLALKHLGYEVVSPKECTLTTEVMETWGDLARQRLRWKRGAVENLIQYGLTRVTFEHWARQLITLLGIFVTAVYLGTLVYALTLAHGIILYPLWIGVTAIFIVERAVTVYKRGWKMSFLAALLFVEMPFDIFLQAVHLKAYWQVFLRSERSW